jgi:hypothetical protein
MQENETKTLPFINKDNAIFCTIQTTGRTGRGWIKHFSKKGVKVSAYARSFLLTEFKPTQNQTKKIVILKGESLTEKQRSSEGVYAEGKRLGYVKPDPEIACHLRDMFTDEQLESMGFTMIIIMHESVKWPDSDGHHLLLSLGKVNGGNWFGTAVDTVGDITRTEDRYYKQDGFAFEVVEE